MGVERVEQKWEGNYWGKAVNRYLAVAMVFVSVTFFGINVFIAEASKTEAESNSQNKTKPKFEDYAVEEIFTGKTTKLVLDAESSQFKTRLEKAAKGKVNFAGRYIITQWGCGADCSTGAIIDAKTGKVYLIPFAVCCARETDEDNKKIEFRADSSLLVFNGLLNEDESRGNEHYFEFLEGKFVEIISQDDLVSFRRLDFDKAEAALNPFLQNRRMK